MRPHLVIWADLRVLVADTVRVWWRLLPQLLTLQIGGWLGYQATLWISAAVSLHNGWVALGIFSLGFVFTLGSIVLMLRLVGRELGIRALISAESDNGDHRADHGDEHDDSISRLLALTLLPFLGIYAAFNYVSNRAEELNVRSLLQAGILSDKTLLGQLNPTTSTKRLIIVVCIVVGAYLLRRGLDLLHERTDWRWLGVVVAAVEGFFILTLLLSGQKLVNKFTDWLFDRQVFGWLDALEDKMAGFFSLFKVDLPEVIDHVIAFIGQTVWPSFLDVMAEPVAWLAVAALVYGSHVLSLANLWRKGQPLSSEVPLPSRLRRVRERKVGSTGFRRAALEFQEVFLGDIDDKYLPTLQSIRLILRSGLTFLGAYLLIYTLIRSLRQVVIAVLDMVTHGKPVTFWVPFGSFFDLAADLLTEPLRIVLLGVAFHRCLLLFKARAADVHTDDLPAEVVRRVEGTDPDEITPAGRPGPASPLQPALQPAGQAVRPAVPPTGGGGPQPSPGSIITPVRPEGSAS